MRCSAPAPSVVGLRALAVDDARSAATLGRPRQGSGVVIGSGDLVLTIGYLVLEAEQVQLVTDDEREVPARLVGYDVATGFGLVQALAPLRIEPAPFGSTAALARGEPLMIVSGGEDGAISAAQLVSRRAFSGYWEYHVDGALFTAPPRPDHSGAGLFNAAANWWASARCWSSDAAGAGRPARRPATCSCRSTC